METLTAEVSTLSNRTNHSTQLGLFDSFTHSIRIVPYSKGDFGLDGCHAAGLVLLLADQSILCLDPSQSSKWEVIVCT